MQANESNLTFFQNTILTWWRENARDFPWRNNRTTYRTAIAELMLRRTQANQVVPVFERFVSDYPTLEAAAQASEETLQHILYPLGLEWRTSNMVACIREAHERYGDDLPTDIAALRTLPGIGDYVGAAIVCFAGGQTHPLIDTNVVRVLGRIFGLDMSGEARRRKSMRELATRAVYKPDAAAYHYAILDFAATICTARNPKCDRCTFSKDSRCDFFVGLSKIDNNNQRYVPQDSDIEAG